MSGQESDSPKNKVLVGLPFDTPVVDIEINPYVNVAPKKSSISVPQHTFTYSWYRKQISFHCSIHPDKLATLQCNVCVKLKLPVEESYYCSRCCFINAWKKHKVSHDQVNGTDRTANGQAGGELRSSGPWHCKDWTKVEWVKVGSSKSYKPTSDDYGSILKLEVVAVDCSTSAQLSPIAVVLENPVINAPTREPRRIIKCSLSGGNFDTKCHSKKDATFSVLSYNVLAAVFASRERYSYCPTWALVWEYRRQKLLNEIIEYDADIICLQEVQSDHFESFFEPELTKRGYSVMYKKKTQLLYTANKYVSDGCATFYRSKLFKVIMKHEVEFEKLAENLVNALPPHLREKYSVRLAKGNVAHIAVLETLDNERFRGVLQSRICVANTHIHANTDSPDVKLFQVVGLVNVLEEIVQSHIPLLICTDLNSPPLSDPHRFIVSGRCNLVDNEIKEHLELLHYLKIHHSLPLASAYASFPVLAGDEKRLQFMDTKAKEPLFTNFTKNFAGTLDYIFYTENSLRVEGLLELLDCERLGPGLPSSVWPSDHIALMARFGLKPPPARVGQRSPRSPLNSWVKTGARQ
ncbi:hypothetical protein L484_003397 [Morus notabilis]|uniref:poly(A)-specific ribonuclease n=1 Tax=Morus notabilis TaxID=981085 RepID=W9RMH7_9ROSA|nr:carbon catabolite repressor protein 4 homolog 1 [Morus notabilis]EXB97553.1 hypothetical protein L484_003397 [Morus notabilis]